MIRRTTWIVLAIFVVLIGVYWYIQRQNNDQVQTTTPTPSSQTVFDTSSEAIQAVRLEDSSGKVVAIERDNQGNWTLTEPKAESADQDKADTFVSQVSNLRSLAIIDTTPAMDVIGLDTPAYTLTIKMADGRQQVAKIGSLTPTSSGYYVEPESGRLMVITKATIDGLVANLENPPVAPTPTVGPSATAAESPSEPTVTPAP